MVYSPEKMGGFSLKEKTKEVCSLEGKTMRPAECVTPIIDPQLTAIVNFKKLIFQVQALCPSPVLQQRLNTK